MYFPPSPFSVPPLLAHLPPAIYPEDSPVLGHCKGEAVYARSSVHTVRIQTIFVRPFVCSFCLSVCPSVTAAAHAGHLAEGGTAGEGEGGGLQSGQGQTQEGEACSMVCVSRGRGREWVIMHAVLFYISRQFF